MVTYKNRMPVDPIYRLAWRLDRYAKQYTNPFGSGEYNTQKAEDLKKAARLIRKHRKIELGIK